MIAPVRKKTALDRHLEVDPWRYMSRLFGTGLGKMNVAFNTFGVIIYYAYLYFLDTFIGMGRLPYVGLVAAVTYISVIVLAITVGRIWLRKIRLYVELIRERQTPSPELTRIARRKVINLPLFAAVNSLAAWSLAAIVSSVYRLTLVMPMHTFGDTLIRSATVFIGTFITGVITSALTFFIVEIICQHIWPFFFPEGDPTRTPGIIRPTLRIRILLHFVLSSLVPLILMVVLSYGKARQMLVQDPNDVIGGLLVLMLFILLSTIFAGFIMSRLLAHTIVDPVHDLETAMERVAQGELDARVTVASIDELGDLTVQFNRMAEGLRDRERMRQSLELAMEVQQNLLPKSTPQIPGLDMVGVSLYCDETGGDYYDFLTDNPDGNLHILVGDVSEHGIPSALLMATARAFVRQRLAMPGRLDSAVYDVNQQFCRDVDETGRFMTLLCCCLNTADRTATWVNAGHAPALIYQPKDQTFSQPEGGGPALGVVEEFSYTETRTILEPDQIILMGTDGIWETQNAEGEPFGLERVKQCVVENADKPAQDIIDRLVAMLEEFRGDQPQMDDVTAVLIKVGDLGSAGQA
jgi:serine phosphatase RsbU (regulator of sigma subunit)